MEYHKPFAPACERNQQVIYETISSIIDCHDQHLLELGSGTGQHAVYMAPLLPDLQWQTSDLIENHDGIKSWLREANQHTILPPLYYEAGKTPFPDIDIDVVFTANTLHIMSWQNVKVLIKQMGEQLKTGTKIMIYGPFNHNGEYTSESNAKFDQWLYQKNTQSAIRDFEDIESLMQKNSMQLIKRIKMPANNELLYYRHK